jgi:hypothetical protein
VCPANRANQGTHGSVLWVHTQGARCGARCTGRSCFVRLVLHPRNRHAQDGLVEELRHARHREDVADDAVEHRAAWVIYKAVCSKLQEADALVAGVVWRVVVKHLRRLWAHWHIASITLVMCACWSAPGCGSAATRRSRSSRVQSFLYQPQTLQPQRPPAGGGPPSSGCRCHSEVQKAPLHPRVKVAVLHACSIYYGELKF